MKVLAFETSSMVASVALLDEEKVIVEFSVNNKKTHSQMLMPIMEQVISKIDIELKDIDVFAVSNGPGSFTGIRIGVSTVKSLAQALKKPVLGVSSLDGLAFNLVNFSDIICPIMDARNAQVYTALYRSNGTDIDRFEDYIAIRVSDLADMLNKLVENIMFCGDGAPIYKNILKEILGERAKFAQSPFMFQRASSIGFLALQKAKLNLVLEYNELQPFYLRKSQAEQKLESLRKKN